MASIISAGTTSGTSLNLSGDTSGVLQLASNGSTTAVTIDTSQNVGIGSTSPVSLLEVKDASPILTINQTDTSTTCRLAFYGYNRNYETTAINTTEGVTAGAGNLAFFTNPGGSGNSTERMRITSTGQLNLTRATGDDTQIDFLRMQGGGVVAADNLAFLSKYTTTVTTSAKPIFGGPPRGCIVVVTGYTGASYFSDILNCSSNSVSVISSQNSTGSPASRTYSIVSFVLNLVMGSGTYNVATLLLGTSSRE
jgi:hypothetical protein